MSRRPAVLVLGPHREAVSGVSTHLNLLFASQLAEEFSLTHFQVGSEGRSEGMIGRWLRLAFSPFALAATILARGVALVHLNTSLNVRAYWRDLVYLAVAKLCGARVLYQLHGGALPQEFASGGGRAALLRRTLELPDAIVVLAQAELDAYRSFVPAQQVLLLPNGIDCTPYGKLARAPRPASAVLRLVYIGRLAREKGLYEALEGLALARGVRAELEIAGSGPEETLLRCTAVALGLKDRVRFTGPVSGARKLEMLGAADVLVLPSYGEGLPYALLEGMAAGAAVIATRVGAVPDVVVDGVHGILVPPRDAKALRSAITRLAEDRGLLERMGVACRRRIAGGYSLERMSERLDGLYAELCAG